MSDTAAQGTDSLAAHTADSVLMAKKAVMQKSAELSRKILSRHPYFNFMIGWKCAPAGVLVAAVERSF